MKHLIILCLLTIGLLPLTTQAQTISREELVFLTSQWEGERFPDGRPRVPDAILERMKNVTIEEAWGVIREEGFHNQFEGGWKMIHADRIVVGRALTVQYLPNRPDVSQPLLEHGHAEGRIGATNSWPIDMLQVGDVYVADGFGKVDGGTLIGDNLGNAIYTNSKNGVIFDGSLRDLEGLEAIDGFNAFVRDWHPSYIQEMMLGGINVPLRIGAATVLPGDVVLAKREGVIFIPAYLAEKVVNVAAFISLRDEFGIMRLREGTYMPGQIDSRWTDAIKADFLQWIEAHPEKLPMSKEDWEAFLKTRHW